jgi:hypothetical protein
MNPEFDRRKQYYGLLYGLLSGLAFAFFAWGIDAFLLLQAHVACWWGKLLPGLLICLAAAGLVGWWTAYTDSHWMALLGWGGLAILLSRMLTWLPLTEAPRRIEWLAPGLAGDLHYSSLAGLGQFHLVGLVITGLAGVIGGLLEISLIDQALLSPYGSGAITMVVVCLLLFGLAGSASDYLVNSSFREPLQALDKLLHFAAVNQGQEVPAVTARKMHLSAVRNIADLLQKPHSLSLLGFDSYLGQVEILVNFDGSLVKCSAIYAQPTDCVRMTEIP